MKVAFDSIVKLNCSKEAADLIELQSKIEHLPNGTKDTADAAVGSYFNAISSEEVTVLTVPSTPPAVQGISPLSIRSADDPFGLLRGFKPRLCKESILR